MREAVRSTALNVFPFSDTRSLSWNPTLRTMSVHVSSGLVLTYIDRGLATGLIPRPRSPPMKCV